MNFLLLTLLVFAIIVTLVGLFLTTKPRVRNQRIEYSAARSRRQVVESIPSRRQRIVDTVPVVPGRTMRAIVDSAPPRSHRSSVGMELRIARSLSVSAIWERMRGRRTGEPLPWSVITIGLVSIIILGFYAFSVLLPHQVLLSFVWFNPQTASASSNQQPAYHASKDLLRLGQLDSAQYNSTQEYNLWAYSACSAASMTEVINSYGHHYHIADILEVEAGIHEITPAMGLLEDVGIQRTVARFGFKTSWGYSLSLDQIITIANQGRPVIVSFPPYKYPGGHLLVVIGGSGEYVFTADSSRLNRQEFTRGRFLQLWGGFSAIVTPQ